MIAAVGVVVAVLATTGASALTAHPSYRAQSVLLLTPAATGPAARRLTKLLKSGSVAKGAAAILVDKVLAGRATAGVAGTVAVSATVTPPDTITLVVDAGSAADAEAAARRVVDTGTPVVEMVVGQFRLVEITPPAGSAVATGLPHGLVGAAAAPAGFLVGSLLGLIGHRRFRGRA